MPETNHASDLTVASEPVAEGSLLKQHVEAIEHLEEEKAAIADTIKERFAALKADGFDTKAVKAIIAERKKKPHEVSEFEMLLDTYKAALGMRLGSGEP